MFVKQRKQQQLDQDVSRNTKTKMPCLLRPEHLICETGKKLLQIYYYSVFSNSVSGLYSEIRGRQTFSLKTQKYFRHCRPAIYGLCCSDSALPLQCESRCTQYGNECTRLCSTDTLFTKMGAVWIWPKGRGLPIPDLKD